MQSETINGITVFVRVCPQVDPTTAPLSKKASAILDKKSSFVSSYALKNSFISSKPARKSGPTGTSEKCVVVRDDRTVVILRPGAAGRDGDKEYTFDKVFSEESTQEELCVGVHDHVM
jgi:hypothetical protein